MCLYFKVNQKQLLALMIASIKIHEGTITTRPLTEAASIQGTAGLLCMKTHTLGHLLILHTVLGH